MWKMEFFGLSEIGSGFGDMGGTPPPKNPRSTPPPPHGKDIIKKKGGNVVVIWRNRHFVLIGTPRTKPIVKIIF